MFMDIIGRLMMLLPIDILTLVSLISLSKTFDLYLKVQEHLKDTKGAIRSHISCKSKNRQYNRQKGQEEK